MNLVLLRHGESEWNRDNRFTGWTDVDLSAQGIQEAHRAAGLLRKAGLRFDLTYTSVLKRAIRTLWIVLDDLDLLWLPVYRSWRLNERHYGALQGLNKQQMAEEFGEEQVMLWRRSYTVRPPALSADDERHPRFDPRYDGLGPEELDGVRDELVEIEGLSLLYDCGTRLGQAQEIVHHVDHLLGPPVRSPQERELLRVERAGILVGQGLEYPPDRDEGRAQLVGDEVHEV